MAKPHWQITETNPETGETITTAFGCQHDLCDTKATVQWQRAATADEINADATQEGPYGPVIRNPQGPHNVAVFACDTHALPPAQAAIRHTPDCPAPHPAAACECEDQT